MRIAVKRPRRYGGKVNMQSPLSAELGQELVRTMIAIEHEASRSNRFSIALFAMYILLAIVGLAALFSRAVASFPWLIGEGTGRDWLIVIPVAVVAWLLFRVYRRNSELREAEHRLNAASLLAIRRDFLDR